MHLVWALWAILMFVIGYIKCIWCLPEKALYQWEKRFHNEIEIENLIFILILLQCLLCVLINVHT